MTLFRTDERKKERTNERKKERKKERKNEGKQEKRHTRTSREIPSSHHSCVSRNLSKCHFLDLKKERNLKKDRKKTRKKKGKQEQKKNRKEAHINVARKHYGSRHTRTREISSAHHSLGALNFPGVRVLGSCVPFSRFLLSFVLSLFVSSLGLKSSLCHLKSKSRRLPWTVALFYLPGVCVSLFPALCLNGAGLQQADACERYIAHEQGRAAASFVMVSYPERHSAHWHKQDLPPHATGRGTHEQSVARM